MKYQSGDLVVLAPLVEDGEELQPRQSARVCGGDQMPWGVAYVVEVEPEDEFDDGLREVSEDQIEGLQPD